MPVTLGTFINELAQITGNGKLDTLTALLADANKANVELPDDVVSGIKGKIFTLESAKASPELHEHFFAVGRGGVDTEMERFWTDERIDPAIITELKAEKNTGKRAVLLAKKLRELEQAKISATGGDKKVLSDKIESLERDLSKVNADLLSEKEQAATKLSEKENEMLNSLRDYQENQHFSSYVYANEKIPLSVHVRTAKGLFEEKAKELGLKTVFDKTTGQVRLLTSTDSVYYKDNKAVDYKTFTDGLLAENHLLKVTDTSSPEQGAGNPKTIVITSNGQGNRRDTSKMTEAQNKSLAEMSQVTN